MSQPMRAVQVSAFGGPEVLKLAEVPIPEPGPGQVLIRVRAAGVNPVDTYIRAGQYAIKPELPYIPGIEGAGEVVSVVPTGVAPPAWPRVGERVWFHKRGRDGAYAQHIVCELDAVHPLPGRLSFAQGAAIYVAYCTAWRSIFQVARARAGESILIHGASGGVGLAAVQCARAAGLRVAGTAGTDAGRRLIVHNGAEIAFDHRAPGYEAKISEWAKAGGEAGPSIILEMLANVNLQRDLDLVGHRGRIVIVGNRGTIEVNPRATMSKDAGILGMSLFNMRPEEGREVFAAVGAGLANGTLTPIVAQEIGLEEPARAHQAVIERGSGGALGKVVLIVR